MMTTPPDLIRAQWRKSSRSSGNGQCVEVAGSPGVVGVRDSKSPEPVLVMDTAQWKRFVHNIKSGAHQSA
ncbi:DUF397 domain-containing protein [Spirillospora sp. NPDC050679]